MHKNNRHLGHQQIADGFVEFPQDIHFTMAIKEFWGTMHQHFNSFHMG